MLALAVALAFTGPHVTQASSPLECHLVPSSDPAFQDRWNFVEAAQFTAQRTKFVYRGQRFLFYGFFEGYGLDGEGNAALTYEARITRPDGETYYEERDLVGWNREVPDPASVLLAEGLFGCSFDPVDPLGVYTAWIRVTDASTGSSAEAKAEIELVEYEEGAAFPNFDALERWKAGYAASPELQRVVPALWLHCRSDGFLPTAKDQSLDGFLLEILERNEWLLPHVFDGLEERTPAERRGALWLLAHAAVESAPFVDALSKEDQALWEELSGDVRDPMRESLRERHDVNEVYGRYLASRRMEPLQRLVLALHEDGDAIASETVRDAESGTDVPLARVVPKVVARLLDGLIRVDPVAHSYARTLAMADLPPGVAAELDRLLADAK